MNPADVDPRVQQTVLAWGDAEDVDAAAQILESARRELPAELVVQLVDEVAEISAELMLELLTLDRGVDRNAEPVEINGMSMLPRQAERFSEWLIDQKRTADALGLDHEAWIRQMERGFDRYIARVKGDEETEAEPETHAEAQRLLGQTREAFEARPEPGESERAGLSGMLAARDFAKKKK